MNKLPLLLAVLSLTACGTMGIGSNHKVQIHNNSADVVNATGDMGTFKIQPNSSITVKTSESIELKSTRAGCDTPTIQRTPNNAALVLDIFPGLIVGILPIVIDGITGNLYKMPSEYVFECI